MLAVTPSLQVAVTGFEPRLPVRQTGTLNQTELHPHGENVV